MVQPVKDFTIEELESLMESAGLSSFRAQSLLVWLYGRGVDSYDAMTDMPKVIREQFALAFPLYVPEIVEKQVSRDGSRKYLLRYHDGVLVETVGLPSEDGRLSVCCSSQAGCAMGCAFCATGQGGFKRNLTAGEIVDQVLVVQRDFGERVTNVVMMGQGEPFANYDAVLGALRIMNHPKLLNIGARHITLSTCGLVEGVDRLAQEPEQFTLAVSLHSARQPLRDALMPAMASQRLGTLRAALERYTEATGRRFSLEYALMEGVNDSQEDLDALIAFGRRMLCHVNLIPLNAIEGSEFQPSSQETLGKWLQALEEASIPGSIRRSRGSDIQGACGQLAAQARE